VKEERGEERRGEESRTESDESMKARRDILFWGEESRSSL
jgi:hypothetical protein